MKIIIAGGTGFIGQALTRHFIAQNHRVVIVGRELSKIKKIFGPQISSITWKELTQQAAFHLQQADLIINLAGANIAAKKWSTKRKREIIESRVKTTRLIAELCSHFGKNSPPLFNASAVGIYGLQTVSADNSLPTPFEETSPLNKQTTDFVSQVGQAWEEATLSAKEAGVRVVNLRFGLVLGKKGLLGKLRLPFLLGLGGPIDTGNQPFPWVSLVDVMAAIDFLISHKDIQGPVNVVSPECLSQGQFAKAFAQSLSRPALITTPAIFIHFLFGEMGQELLLNGQCAYPAVLLSNGFKFKYADIHQALANINSNSI